MNSSHQIHWMPLILALMLALLSWWLNRLTMHPTVVDNAGFNHDPDYIVEHFDALTFNTAGQPQYRLTAQRMTHYMDDDTTILERPVFRSEDRSRPVEVQSLRAQISSDGHFVHFLDQVHVVRRDPEARAPVTLDTDYLRVTPDQQTMDTDHPVTLRQGNSIIKADAMSADGKRHTLVLTGDVRGVHEQTR
jgi:lipopolysaccharide export system protein LptC